MQKGEIWVSDFDEGKAGYLIGACVEPGVWERTSLIKIKNGEYALDKGGRVSSRIDPAAYYTGEGQLFEYEFSKFHHKVEGLKIKILTASNKQSTPLVFGKGTRLCEKHYCVEAGRTSHNSRFTFARPMSEEATA